MPLPAQGALGKLAELAGIAPRRRKAFTARVHYVLAEHEVASRELDRDPIRAASKLLRRLAECVARTREALRAAEHEIGITDLGSYGQRDASGASSIPWDMRDILAKFESGVRELHGRSIRPGAPTKAALDYTILQLFEVHRQHQGTHLTPFVRGALALIGCAPSARKLGEVIGMERRRMLLVEWNGLFGGMAVAAADVRRGSLCSRTFRRVLEDYCQHGKISTRSIEGALRKLRGATFGTFLTLRRIGDRWSVVSVEGSPE